MFQAPAGPSRRRTRVQHETSDTLDADMLALVAQMGLNDITEIEERRKGKGRADATPSDADLALTLFAEEARAFRIRESDRALAQSLQEEEDWMRPPLRANPVPRAAATLVTQPVLERVPPARGPRNAGVHHAPVARRVFTHEITIVSTLTHS